MALAMRDRKRWTGCAAPNRPLTVPSVERRLFTSAVAVRNAMASLAAGWRDSALRAVPRAAARRPARFDPGKAGGRALASPHPGELPLRVEEERRTWRATGSLAEELPYWGWLGDGRTCLTRAGELVAVGRIRPAATDGRTPGQIDRVLGLWQRLLSLILGATGSGKSFALNFLLAEALKYRPRVLILDLGDSYRWLTRFLGGHRLELAPGATEPGMRLRPFALPATPRTFRFLTGWVLRLMRLGGLEPGGADANEIRARIEDLYALKPECRTLSALTDSLPAATRPTLGRWREGGVWGAFFDNAPTGAADIEFRDWQVVDLAGAAEHADLCEAAFSYLLERMRLEIEDPAETTRLKLMVVDEAWPHVRDPAVLNCLADAVRTWRKKNAVLILAARSAADATRTAGASALFESIPTRLFLANPELPEEAGALFRLNEAELARIRDLAPKRELYLRDGPAPPRGRPGELLALHTSSLLDAEKRARAVARYGLARGLAVLAGCAAPSRLDPEDAP